MASGLLVVAIGKATRLLRFMPLEPKRYRFTMRFGTATDTLDTEGRVVEEGGAVPQESSLRDILARFIGEIRQVPPRFSAVKVGGTRAYKLARQERSFELTERTVQVHALELHAYDPTTGEATLSLSCSTGTYVRSLVRDLAAELGTIAVTSAIRRLGIGAVTVAEAHGPAELERDARNCLVPVHRALAGLPGYRANEQELRELGYGRDIAPHNLDCEAERLFVFGPDEELVAVTRRTPRGTYHPERVLSNRPPEREHAG
jgi:tRNA pseudouridine55 synthase